MWKALGEYRGPSSYRAFVRYVFALYERDMREIVYRTYVTDALRNIPQMKYSSTRWVDTLNLRGAKDDRSADEIVDDVVAALSGGK